MFTFFNAAFKIYKENIKTIIVPVLIIVLLGESSYFFNKSLFLGGTVHETIIAVVASFILGDSLVVSLLPIPFILALIVTTFDLVHGKNGSNKKALNFPGLKISLKLILVMLLIIMVISLFVSFVASGFGAVLVNLMNTLREDSYSGFNVLIATVLFGRLVENGYLERIAQ